MKNASAGYSRQLLFCVVVGLCSAAQAGSQDWKIWLDQNARHDLSDRVSIRAKQSFRLEDDAGTLGTYYIEAGLAYRPTPWLHLSPAFRRQLLRDSGEWLNEERPYMDATLRWQFHGLALSHRNRFEYRFRESRDDTFRYRNKLTLVVPRKWTRLELQPYLAGEIFVDEGVKAKDRNRTRAYAGVKTDPAPHLRKLGLKPKEGRRLTSDYYLIYQSTDNNDDTVDEFIAGLNLGVAF